MVLDDASPQAGLPPNNNASPGASSAPRMTPDPIFAKYFPLKIKPELVVKPDLFTLYFGFFGANNWRRCIANSLTDRIEHQWIVTNRFPTQDEMDVYTTANSRGLYYKTMGLPASAFLSTAWVYRSLRKDPVWPERMGTPAELMKHFQTHSMVNREYLVGLAVKSSFKMLFLTTTGYIISSFVGSWADAQTVITDPRMKPFTDDLRHISKEDMQKRRMHATVDRVRRERSGEKTISVKIREDLSNARGYDRPQSDYDSPASYGQSESDTSYNTYQDDQNNSRGQSAPYTSRPQAYGTPRGMGNEPASQSNPGSDFFLSGSDDDASPTAPEYRNTNPDGSSTGSAWDRVRHQNNSGAQQPQARQPRMQQWGQQNTPESDYAPTNDQDRYNERRRDKEQGHADSTRW
ncbi:uncharacterized protein N7498_008337 [Penicillium cinerascens]|uniref:Uncharacterized protein n=1 Tax=Penicillium cinerascens TaxID=70096 RepID=A0A9W9JEI1_9EURO|nr:uncharacterized protein N7498_008337 [Penicillium cinerascens]KAJ5194899.1 hypothetical protein N7498_008337 [Penicillium cinerascens]